MSDTNLNLYKIFCVVAESRNYKEASEKLFVSESTISSHIKNLENKLDITLFYREKDGLVLTIEGKKLYDSMSEKIRDIEFAEESLIQECDFSKAKLTIGCPSHISISYLAKCLKKVKEDYPDLKIDLVGASNYSGLIDKLQKHLVDFIILDVIPNEVQNEIKVKELKDINNVFIYNKPLKIDNLKELENYNFILNFENSISTKQLFECLNKYDVHIKADIHSDITEMRIEEVKQGQGIGYVIKEATEDAIKNRELYEVELPISLPRIKINLLYIDKYLTKMDKIFIKKYLEK